MICHNSQHGAKDMWGVLSQDDFVRIPNRFYTIPRKGDIFVMDVWSDSEVGRYGHTGIVLSGGPFRFTSFDSNWSVKNTAFVERHNYINPRVIGFFRPKVPSVITTLSRVNEALRALGEDPTRSVGTLNLSRWWQNRISRDPEKFTNDEAGYQAMINAIKWHQANSRYPHDV